MLLFLKYYVFHLAVVRHNHYVEGLFGGTKPLLRGATVWQFRLLALRQKTLDFGLVLLESFEISLFFSRFVFFLERGRDYDFDYARGARFIEKEDYIAEEDLGDLGRPGASMFFGGFHSRHFFGLAVPVSYLNSFSFWKSSGLSYMYFVYSHIQASPKKFAFTKSWVSLWMSLPVMGGLWMGIQREFIERFWEYLMQKYFVLLLTSRGFFNSTLLEIMGSSVLRTSRWDAFVP